MELQHNAEVVKLGGELTVHDVEAAAEALRAIVADVPEHLTVDVAGLTSLDAAGAQLLVATARSSAAGVTFVSWSDPALDLLHKAGLDEHLVGASELS